MAPQLPSTTVRLLFATLAGQGAESALLIAPVGAGGTGTPSVPLLLTSSAQALGYFGASQGSEAAALWFDLGLGQDIELYAFGIDATGFTANTWTLTTTGTATAAGTQILRLSSYTVPVNIADTNNQDAVAAAQAAAITAANVPFSAAAVLGVCTVTSDYVGLAITRVNVSVDKYSDRGELGVAGIDTVVVNDAVGVGEPTALITTNLTDTDHQWYLHDSVGTAWLDSVQSWANLRWDNANNWLQPMQCFASADEATVTSTFDARNDTHATYHAQSDMPAFELEAIVSVLRAIKDEETERGTVPISTENRPLQGVQAPSVNFDSQIPLNSGVGTIIGIRGQATNVLVVNQRREDVLMNDDFRFFDMGTVLSVRTLLGRIKGALDLQQGRAILESPAANAAQAPYVTSVDTIQAAMEALMVQAWKDALLSAANEATARSVVTSVTPLVAGGITTGFDVRFNPRAVSLVRQLLAIVTLRGSAQ